MYFNISPVTRWGLNALVLLAVVMALYLGRTIFIPTILALLLSAMLWPAATWLNLTGIPEIVFDRKRRFPWFRCAIIRRRIPWGVSCLVVVVGLVAINVLITVGSILAVGKLLQDLPTNYDAQVKVYTSLRSKLENISPVPFDTEYLPRDAEKSKVFEYIRTLFDPKQPYIIAFLREVGSVAVYWLWQWILIMFILLFLMVEGRMLSRRVVEIFGPTDEAQHKAVGALGAMAVQVRTYLVWRTLINFGIAFMLGVVYYFTGLNQPWTWALMSSILWYVPYLGPIAAGVPPVIDAFVSCDSAWVAIGILVLYTVVVMLEGYVIVPLVMGQSMELNATTVMLACMFWELVWGLPGLFLAMPLMAAVKAICEHVPDGEPWANLMSTREAELEKKKLEHLGEPAGKNGEGDTSPLPDAEPDMDSLPGM